ncbi:amidohydrolase family protein [uncultured Sphingomonas sp.]|uniref:amidohydrolase family protein n=1 Tax=uncultured Sphingomonas sp. TaxID=158754 RepID=UPI0035C9BFC9
MIIDCHGHFTTVPQSFRDFREKQVAAANDPVNAPSRGEAHVSDDEIRSAIEGGQLRLQQERGGDLTLFSPIASLMSHHRGNERTSLEWATISNDLVKRVAELYPDNFVPVCMLPQSPNAPPANSVPELRRCVEELGFIGVNINPDPSGGYWTGKPFTDREWYPLFEALCDLDVPGMVHVAASCNPNFHSTGAHYINADTSVFMQILQSNLFDDFPTLRLIIPHGGGAVPYHWGRYRGMSLEIAKRPLEGLLDNIFFDTCVYHLPGVELLTKVIPAANVLFGSEMIGAVKGIDPNTGDNFDDTKKYVEALPLSADDKASIFEGNARRVYPRLDALLKGRGK